MDPVYDVPCLGDDHYEDLDAPMWGEETNMREDKMHAAAAWVSDAEADELTGILGMISTRGGELSRGLERKRKAWQAEQEMLNSIKLPLPGAVDPDTGRRLRKDGTPRAERKDKDHARSSRAVAKEPVAEDVGI